MTIHTVLFPIEAWSLIEAKGVFSDQNAGKNIDVGGNIGKIMQSLHYLNQIGYKIYFKPINVVTLLIFEII